MYFFYYKHNHDQYLSGAILVFHQWEASHAVSLPVLQLDLKSGYFGGYMSYSIPKRKLSQSGYFWLCWVSGAALALADSGASPSPMFNVGSPMTDKEYQIFIPSPSLRY